MVKFIFFTILVIPWLHGCFDPGPSDEELFKQTASTKKVFPPNLTNVKEGDTLKENHSWEGTCGTNATVEISSPKIKGGVEKIPCVDKKFSKVLTWDKVDTGKKQQVKITQSKDGAKSIEVLVNVVIDGKTKEVAKVETAPTPPQPPKKDEIKAVVAPVETKAAATPIAVQVESKAAATPIAAKVETVQQPVVTTPVVAPTPEVVKVLPPPTEVKELNTKVSAIAPAVEDEKFKINNSNEVLIDLTGAVVINEVGAGGGKLFSGAKNLIDEQRIAGDPKTNKGNNGFKTSWSEAARLNKELEYQKPFLSGIFDLGKFYELTEVYLFGGNNVVSFYSGGPVNDWLMLGQTRLRPGVWNKVSFNKKINSKYLRVTIDFLSNDLDGAVTASSGSEMVLYGKPFDERSPAGVPQPRTILPPPTFDEFVGVNLYVSDPVGDDWIYSQDAHGKLKQKFNTDIKGVEAFNHTRVKLYTPWFLTHFDQDSPNWLLRFQSINLEHHNLDLDYFFNNLSKQRSVINNKPLSILPSFEYTIPSLFPDKVKEYLTSQKILKKDAEGNSTYPWSYGKVKPLSTSDKVSGKIPKDYKDEAELYYQYSARFGKNPASLNDKNRKLASDQKMLSGQNTISAIEAHAFPDRSSVPTLPECSYFHPFEYAAYLSALFDGDQSSLGSNYGAKNADASTPLVFGSLSIPSIDYPLMVSLWAKEHRQAQTLPFDVLAYTASSRIQGKAATPEASGLYETYRKLVLDRNSFFPDRPLWITEFGFESNPSSMMGVTVAAGYTPEIAQGIWLTRGLLLLNAAGIDRVYLQPLFDNPHFNKNSYGLVQSPNDNYKVKDSYYLVTSLMKALQGYSFDKIVDGIEDSKGNLDVVSLKFKRQDNPKKFIYVTWTPTNNGVNHQLSQYQLPSEEKPTKAQIISLSSSSIEATRSPASINEQGIMKIDAKEIPTLVEVEIP